MLAFIASFILTAAVALIQATNWFLVGSTVKPDLLLALLVALMMAHPNWPKRLILIVLAAFIIKENPGIALSNLVFPAALVAAALIVDILPWEQTVNAMLAAAAGTLVISLQSFTFLPFIYELAFNLGLTFIIINLITSPNVPQIKLQRNRL